MMLSLVTLIVSPPGRLHPNKLPPHFQLINQRAAVNISPTEITIVQFILRIEDYLYIRFLNFNRLRFWLSALFLQGALYLSGMNNSTNNHNEIAISKAIGKNNIPNNRFKN
jgi:hypothetical protein